MTRIAPLPRQPHETMSHTTTDPTELVAAFTDKLSRFFRSHGIAYADAEDLVQDTFRVFLEKPLDGVKNRAAFLWGIARNKLRQNKTRPRTYEEYRSSLGPEVLTTLSQRVDRELRIQGLLMRLTEDLRTVFLLRCEGLTIDEIAAIVDASPATVKRRLADTREEIRELSRKDAAADSLTDEDVADHYREM